MIETCDDGFPFDGIGCSPDCLSSLPGWVCSFDPFTHEINICQSVCGDGRVVGLETCDEGVQTGCKDNTFCNETNPGWTCTGGDALSPT